MRKGLRPTLLKNARPGVGDQRDEAYIAGRDVGLKPFIPASGLSIHEWIKTATVILISKRHSISCFHYNRCFPVLVMTSQPHQVPDCHYS